MWSENSQSAPSDEVKAQGPGLAWLLMRTSEANPSLPQITSGTLKFVEATQKGADELARAAAMSN